LLFSDGVFAFLHALSNEVGVVHFLGNPKGVRVLLELLVNLKGGGVGLHHLISVRRVGGATGQIQADSLKVVDSAELNEIAESLDF
jgi:hypothetical protein